MKDDLKLSFSLYLLGARITGVCHHTLLIVLCVLGFTFIVLNYVYICVGMCVRVQVPAEAREPEFKCLELHKRLDVISWAWNSKEDKLG